jgi:hypothetical protein
MLRRGWKLLVLVAVCALATPLVRLLIDFNGTSSTTSGTKPIPTDAEWQILAETDAVAALEASMQRYRRDVQGFTALFCKQERIGGKLRPEETIRVAFRDEPFAVFMSWVTGGGTASATVYVRGENEGKMLAQVPVLGARPTDPRGFMPRQSARYSIEEFGLVQSTKRTLAAWSAARDNGTLKTEYLGRKAIPELNGQMCHVIRRLCPTDEIDAYAPGDDNAVTPKNQADAFRTVTVYLSAESWLQLGTELRRADGELAGAYWFRELVVNPKLPANQFTAAAMKK